MDNLLKLKKCLTNTIISTKNVIITLGCEL